MDIVRFMVKPVDQFPGQLVTGPSDPSPPSLSDQGGVSYVG